MVTSAFRWRVVGYVSVPTLAVGHYRFEIAEHRWKFFALLHRWWLDVGHFAKVTVERIEDGQLSREES